MADNNNDNVIEQMGDRARDTVDAVKHKAHDVLDGNDSENRVTEPAAGPDLYDPDPVDTMEKDDTQLTDTPDTLQDEPLLDNRGDARDNEDSDSIF